MSRQTAVMDDQVTTRDGDVEESEGRYSPLTNHLRPSTSPLDGRARTLVEPLLIGVWLVDNRCATNGKGGGIHTWDE
ncbi:MAG: hypothetical protein WCI87_05575 [Euryarchaeota archaeon]